MYLGVTMIVTAAVKALGCWYPRDGVRNLGIPIHKRAVYVLFVSGA